MNRMSKETAKWKGRIASVAAIVGTVAILIALPTGQAATVVPFVASAHSHSFNCQGNAGVSPLVMSGPPRGSQPLKVLTLTWKAVGDEDSGAVGYWAMDSYLNVLTVWQLRAGTYAGQFYFTHGYGGVFQVPQGALSPNVGTVEPAAGYGTMSGGSVGFLSGVTFTPGANLVMGNLGTFNYGGTTSDILKGSYGNGQTGSTTPYSWVSTYFTGTPSETYNWGWSYQLNKYFWTSGTQTSSGNEWCDWYTGLSGDILTATGPAG